MPNLKVKEYKKFEDIKYIRKDGIECWSARELAAVLEYSQWRNFQKVIERAMIACENSGHDVIDDFAEVSKIVEAGATSKSIKDYELTRYACYLIVQNGDPRKEALLLGKLILQYKLIVKKYQSILINLMKIGEDLLFVEISNNGISFWWKLHMMQELSQMKNLQFFKMLDISDCMVD